MDGGSLESLNAIAAHDAWFDAIEDICRTVLGEILAATYDSKDPLARVIEGFAAMAAEDPERIKDSTYVFGLDHPRAVALRSEFLGTIGEVWIATHNDDREKGKTPHRLTLPEAAGWVEMFRNMLSAATELESPEERRSYVREFLSVYRRAHPFA